MGRKGRVVHPKNMREGKTQGARRKRQGPGAKALAFATEKSRRRGGKYLCYKLTLYHASFKLVTGSCKNLTTAAWAALAAMPYLHEDTSQGLLRAGEAGNCKGKYALFELWRPMRLG